MKRRSPPKTPWHPPLNPDDAALWEEVKKTIKPSKKSVPTKNRIKPPAKSVAPAKQITPVSIKTEKKILVQVAPLPTPAFDRITLRKIKKGRAKIEDRIDLHGMRQETAHRALESFILNAQARGLKLVLVITGKGDRFAGKGGVLRQNVPRWLKETRLSRTILSFSTATIAHGGEGAFYVRLRKL